MIHQEFRASSSVRRTARFAPNVASRPNAPWWPRCRPWSRRSDRTANFPLFAHQLMLRPFFTERTCKPPFRLLEPPRRIPCSRRLPRPTANRNGKSRKKNQEGVNWRNQKKPNDSVRVSTFDLLNKELFARAPRSPLRRLGMSHRRAPSDDWLGLSFPYTEDRPCPSWRQEKSPVL